MGTIPTSPTFTSGQVLTAQDLTDITAVPDFWSDVPRVSVYGSSYSSHSNATQTLESFDSEYYDTDTMHSTSSNTSRLVVNTPGYYAVQAAISWNPNTTGVRLAVIRLNAAGSSSGGTLVVATYASPPGSSNQCTCVTPVVELSLAANDYLELFGYQNSGGALAPTDIRFSMRLVAP